MSFDHFLWSSTESTLRPMIFVLRLSNSGLMRAMYPSSVVQTGVKSLGCEKRTAHWLPIHWWKSIGPSVVWAVKLGASSPIRNAMGTTLLFGRAGNPNSRRAFTPGVSSVLLRPGQHRLPDPLCRRWSCFWRTVTLAGSRLPDAGSVALHESLGFRRIGVYPGVGYKLGAWHDVGWWQLSLRERAASPAPPRALSEAQRDPAWSTALAAGAAR